MKYKMLVLFVVIQTLVSGQVYQEYGTALPAFASGDAVWADVDNDLDMDCIFTGVLSDGVTSGTKMLINNGSSFTFTNTTIPGMVSGAIALADFDNDGFVDLAITGNNEGTGLCQVWKNNGSGFSLHQDLIGLKRSSLAWGDLDNDGDADLVAAGNNNAGNKRIFIYRNEAGVFTEAAALVTSIPGIIDGDLELLDFDLDSDLDLLISGLTDSGPRTMLFVNNGDSFGNTGFAFRNLQQSALAVGDLDNDGDPDFVANGVDLSVAPAEILTLAYRNDLTGWTERQSPLPGAQDGDIAVGDYDNDGDLDVLLSGNNGSNAVTILMRSDGSSFANAGETFSGLSSSSLAFGDFDSDHDLDILEIGFDAGTATTKIYVNNNAVSNVMPGIPTRSMPVVNGSSATLSWTGSTDSNQPTQSLSYNLRVGTTLNGTEIMGPVAHPLTGKRRIAAPGNAGHNFSWHIDGLAPGNYYWSVQAIDNSYEGSEFQSNDATGQFTIGSTGNLVLTRPNGGERLEINSNYVIRWSSSGVNNVRLEFSTTNNTNWKSIVTSTSASSGTYGWHVPNDASEFCRVRITDVDDAGVSDVSDNLFTIGDFTAPEWNNFDYDYTHQIAVDLPVSINVTDNLSVADVLLFFREGGAGGFSSLNMTETSSSLYEATIPGSVITERGLEFYVQMVDESVNMAFSDTAELDISIPNGVQAGYSFIPGRDVTNYRLFSVPIAIDNPSASAFLAQNNMPDYDPAHFRLFSYDNASDQLWEFPASGNIDPGKGFFFITDQSNVTFVSGPGHNVSTLSWFSINLPQGWSLIGNPYSFEIPYDSLYTDPDVNFTIWDYDGTWTINTAGLVPWHGYAIYVPAATTLEINPEFAGLSKPSAVYSTANNSREEWIVRITADNGLTKNATHFFGRNRAAQIGTDRLDLVQPPRIEKTVQVQFLNDETAPKCADIRPAGADGQSWDLQILTDVRSKRLKLHFEGIDLLDDDIQLILRDEWTGDVFNLKQSNTIEVLTNNQSQRRFTLLSGSDDFVNTQTVGNALLPQHFALHQNFPNPFNPATQINFDLPQDQNVKITVFDANGRMVELLADRSYPAGHHSLVWNAAEFSSGVYLIRLESQAFHAVRKAMLIK